MTPLENTLRDTLRQRERDIEIAPVYRVPLTDSAPIRRPSRWRRYGVPLTAAAALVAVIGGGFAIFDTPTKPPTTTTTPVVRELVGPVRTAPPGQQFISSRGLEIAVPANWLINNTGCGQSAEATAVRGRVSGADCFSPEPATQDIAVIGAQDLTWLPIQLTSQYVGSDGFPSPAIPSIGLASTLVSGHRAERGIATLPDGRTVGFLRFTDVDVALAVRATTPAVVDEILGSARIVDIDFAGCPTERPDGVGFVATATVDPLPDIASAVSASVCEYWDVDGPLTASAVVAGVDLAEVKQVVAALHDSAPGDLPMFAIYSEPSELVLAFRLADGSRRYVVQSYVDGAYQIVAATHPTLIPPPEFRNLFRSLLDLGPSLGD